jgi:hypothetical protein
MVLLSGDTENFMEFTLECIRVYSSAHSMTPYCRIKGGAPQGSPEIIVRASQWYLFGYLLHDNWMEDVDYTYYHFYYYDWNDSEYKPATSTQSIMSKDDPSPKAVMQPLTQEFKDYLAQHGSAYVYPTTEGDYINHRHLNFMNSFEVDAP